MDEVTNVESFFKSHQVHLSRIWLESCINWCKEENLPSNYTLKDLQFKVFEQWLLLDLRELEVPCLPPNLSTQQKYILKDNYTLQLMKVVDISKPKYSQLQRIRNGIPKNLEQEPETSKRMLQLTLTDGVQEIEAMEFRSIKQLNLNLPPGTKIRLMGPIQVRRGRLMLEERNVKVIGGEVDTLLVSNAAENILAQCLNQPLNPNPQVVQDNILTDSVEGENMNETGTSTAIANNTEFNQNIQKNNSANIIQNNNSNSNNQKKLQPPVSIQNLDEFDDELDQEIELLMEIEKEYEQLSKPVMIKSKTPDLFDDVDIDFESIDIPDTVVKQPKLTKQQEIGNFLHRTKEPTIDNTQSTYKRIENSSNFNKPQEPISTFNSSASSVLDNISKEKQNPEKNFLSPSPVIWTVAKLVNTIPNVTSGKFKINAKFKSVVEKMVIRNDEYHLVVEVGDDTSNINLRFHNDIVAELMGLTATGFMIYKDESLRNNTDAQAKALEALKSLQTALISLTGVLEVLVNAKETFPVLVKIL